jgi:hypothetical protein
MSGAIASLLGALVGGLAAIGGAWLQARSTARLQREEAARREEHRQAERTALFQDRRRILARRYLFQLTTAWLSPKQSLDRSGDEFRLLIYSGFLRRYEDPEWNLKWLLEPVRQAFSSA